jgi:hypothetical protein
VSDSVIPTEQFSQLVRERVAALKQLLPDLTRGAPQSAPHRFFSSVHILIDAVERVFAGRAKSLEGQHISDQQKASEIAFAARWAMELLNNIQEQFFPFLERLDSPHVPLAMLPAIQRIALQFDTDVELYLFPTSEHNFGFSGFRNLVDVFVQKFELIIPDDLKEEIQRKAAKLPRWFVFLSFPYVLHDSALHLAPLLHELGHFADFQLGIYKDLLPIDISQSDAARTLVEDICQMRLPLSEEKHTTEPSEKAAAEPTVAQIIQKDVIEQQVFALCGEIVRNWVHEIISDLFALRAGGPAYFYAFVGFAANLGLERPAAMSHPSPAVRIDFMVRELKELHYFSEYSPEPIRSSLQSWEAWVKTQKLEPEDGTMRVAYLAIGENAKRLSDALHKHTPSFSYGTKTYRERVPGITNDLEAGIPPIDRPNAASGGFEPCDFVDILNGAWSAYMFSPGKLENLLDCPLQEKRVRAVRVLNELTLKAIEASEILRKCQELSGTKL